MLRSSQATSQIAVAVVAVVAVVAAAVVVAVVAVVAAAAVLRLSTGYFTIQNEGILNSRLYTSISILTYIIMQWHFNVEELQEVVQEATTKNKKPVVI